MEPDASWVVHCSTGDAAGWRGGDTGLWDKEREALQVIRERRVSCREEIPALQSGGERGE